ncbi:MAG: CPBP family intramembrane glutamic endopeptidase, partial [Pseudomonadota bacterium]
FVAIVSLVWPGISEVYLDNTPDALKRQWLFATLIQSLLLIRMTQWAEREGLGPFAGAVRVSSNWISASIVLGPVILIGSGALVGYILAGGDTNWAYREDANTDVLGPDGFGLMMMVYVILLAPLIEEISYRGIGIGCLLGRGVDPRLAVLITTAGFTLLHAQYTPLGLIPIFITGLFLGWLRVASGSITAPILAHMSANTVVILTMVQQMQSGH